MTMVLWPAMTPFLSMQPERRLQSKLNDPASRWRTRAGIDAIAMAAVPAVVKCFDPVGPRQRSTRFINAIAHKANRRSLAAIAQHQAESATSE
jgi:hypothetical protein